MLSSSLVENISKEKKVEKEEWTAGRRKKENRGYLRDWLTWLWMFDQATTMGDGSHRCGPNPLCPDRIESKCRTEIGGRSPVQSSTDTPGTSASTPTSSSEDGHDKLLGVDPDYCRRILVRGGCTATKTKNIGFTHKRAEFSLHVFILWFFIPLKDFT